MKIELPFIIVVVPLPTLRTTSLTIRVLQLIISAAVFGIFTLLLTHKTSATPILELGVLLAFTITTLFQSSAASILTYCHREQPWLAVLDMVCTCGFVTTTVMARSITANYRCNLWLSEGAGDGILHARGAPGERSECPALRGVFGVAIVQCVFLLATAMLIMFSIKARREEQERLRALAEKVEGMEVKLFA